MERMRVDERTRCALVSYVDWAGECEMERLRIWERDLGAGRVGLVEYSREEEWSLPKK
jgi:hypothetical protein